MSIDEAIEYVRANFELGRDREGIASLAAEESMKDRDGRSGPFAQCGRAIVDVLPKKWCGRAGGSGKDAAAALEEKLETCERYCAFLGDSGAWRVLRTEEQMAILRDGESCFALMRLRALLESSTSGDENGRFSPLLRDLVNEAGAETVRNDATLLRRLEERDDAEKNLDTPLCCL